MAYERHINYFETEKERWKNGGNGNSGTFLCAPASDSFSMNFTSYTHNHNQTQFIRFAGDFNADGLEWPNMIQTFGSAVLNRHWIERRKKEEENGAESENQKALSQKFVRSPRILCQSKIQTVKCTQIEVKSAFFSLSARK